jgi:hemerythrin
MRGEWKERLTTGVSGIDVQHKEIFKSVEGEKV